VPYGSQPVAALPLKAAAPEKAAGWLFLLVLLGIAALLLVSPFRLGIYLEQDFLKLHLASFALFTAWWAARLLRREGGFSLTLLDCCLLALAFFYLLSIFGAADKRAALAELLKVANYLAIYFIVRDLSRRHEYFRRFFFINFNINRLRQLAALKARLAGCLFFRRCGTVSRGAARKAALQQAGCLS